MHIYYPLHKLCSLVVKLGPSKTIKLETKTLFFQLKYYRQKDAALLPTRSLKTDVT